MFAVQYADSSTDDFAFFKQTAHQQGMGLARYTWSRADCDQLLCFTDKLRSAVTIENTTDRSTRGKP